jgi:hypothetical protein
VYENFGKTCSFATTDFSVDAFTDIEDTGPYDESPTQIAQTVFGRVEREDRDVIRID